MDCSLSSKHAALCCFPFGHLGLHSWLSDGAAPGAAVPASASTARRRACRDLRCCSHDETKSRLTCASGGCQCRTVVEAADKLWADRAVRGEALASPTLQ
jgi:hypothetical protein